VNLVKTPIAHSAADTGRPRRQRGLVPGIVTCLQADIEEGRLKTGDKLPPESALMERFEVSRTVIREAISRLQASELVQTRHGIGTFVRESAITEPLFRIPKQDMATAADVISLLELRISLESEAASLAALRREESHLAAMTAALTSFEAAIRTNSDAVPSDFQFHLEVARATGNPYFAELMIYLGTMIIPRTRLRTAGEQPKLRLTYLQRVNHEHESIYCAIREQDPEAARAAMRTHLNNSRERLRRAQKGQSDPVGSP